MKIRALAAILFAGVWAGNASAQITVDTVLTNLAEPYGVALDDVSSLYLTESARNRIIKLPNDANQAVVIAGLSGKPGVLDGNGVTAQFNSPQGLVFARGGLIVADTGNHTLRFVTLNGAQVSTLAGKAGHDDRVDGVGTNAMFSFPAGLAVDPETGVVYVADTKNNAIRALAPDNSVTTVVATGLYEPTAVAVEDSDTLWVADTRNHALKRYVHDGSGWALAAVVGSGSRYVSGAQDSLFSEGALFNEPRGLFWQTGTGGGLIVSDTASQLLRRVYYNDTVSDFSTVTVAGKAGEAGHVDGAADEARLNVPVGLAFDPETLFLYVTELSGSSVRRVQNGKPELPVPAPAIGWVDWVYDSLTGDFLSVLRPVTSQILFDNEQIIAILAKGDHASTSTKYTTQDTELGPPPDPGKTVGDGAPAYRDGTSIRQIDRMRKDMKDLRPSADYRIKAYSYSLGRRPSPVIGSRIVFRVGAPQIVGRNPADFSIATTTTNQNVAIFYTAFPSNIVNNIPAEDIDPLTSRYRKLYEPAQGAALDPGLFDYDSNVVVYARATLDPVVFKDSDRTVTVFRKSDYQANRITFGYDDFDEASSDFVASPGQFFYAPITLKLLEGQEIYSLQFNVSVTNYTDSVEIPAGRISFEEMLVKPMVGVTPTMYTHIPPSMFVMTDTNYVTNTVPVAILITNYLTNIVGEVSTNVIEGTVTNAFVVTNVLQVYTNLLFTNSAANLLGVGWLERAGQTNLYDTLKQDLVTYSMAHDTLFESKFGKVVLGAFYFRVPLMASPSSKYLIDVDRASATADGVVRKAVMGVPKLDPLTELVAGTFYRTQQVEFVVGTNVIQTNLVERLATNLAGDFVHTTNVPSANKLVAIGQRRYVVGDVSNFRWFNAGDFGEGYLLNNDVLQAFQSAAYTLNMPPFYSDFYDAMDSSDGAANPLHWNLSDGNDRTINTITHGDSVLDVSDVFVTFRRSLDPSLYWYARYWQGGVRVAERVPNQSEPSSPTRVWASTPAPEIEPSQPPFVMFSAGEVSARAGQVVNVPIRARISGNWPLRVLMLNLTVVPAESAPALEVPVRFFAADGLGEPKFATSRGAGNYAAAWLSSSVAGLTGDALVGTLQVTLPASATENSAYSVRFDHVSGSPTGIAVFPQLVENGLIFLGDLARSAFGDGIPDAWRLRFFGSVMHPAAQANADADGDGVINWREFRAGTNPVDLKSLLKLVSCEWRDRAANDRGFLLRWPSAPDREYILEGADTLLGGEWQPIAPSIPGNGQMMEHFDPTAGNALKFYRVRLAE